MNRDDSGYRDGERLLKERRFAEAFEIYRRLAADGDPNCQGLLGWMYYEGLGVEKNEEQALLLFKGAAQLGSKVAAFYCGKHALIHERYEEAIQCFQESARQEFGPSLLWLGLVYTRGLGVRQDLRKGNEYLERAAATGNFLARRELALLMIRGKLGLAKVPLGIPLLLYATAVALVDGISRGHSDKLMG